MSLGKKLLAEALRVSEDQLGPETTMKDLKQWDSLAHMELVALVEERLAITLSFEEIVQMVSLPGIEKIIDARGVAA